MSGNKSGVWFGIGASIVVVAAVIAALLTIDSPGVMRMKRFDEQRVQDLQALSENVRAYYRNKGKLPDALDAAVAGAFNMYTRSARDPETNDSYGYRVLEARSFELCAVFQAAMDEDEAVWQPGGKVFWHYQPGRHCFTFDVPVEKTQ